MKKFNTSLHGNLEKTKEILILSERTFAQSARSVIQNVDKMDCKYDLNHQWLHLKQWYKNQFFLDQFQATP